MTLTIEDDSERESAPECFTFALVDVSGGDLEEPTIATICIEDNDGKATVPASDQRSYNVIMHIWKS